MAPELTWETLDWAALDRLRETFLSDSRGGVPYWTSHSDLANYDFTFAQRIGWKWDAVLRELRERGWTPPPGDVLDWGCGSGIAGRHVLEFFGTTHVPALRVFDKSSLAMSFAAEAARKALPKLCVKQEDQGRLTKGSPVGVLVLSHVLNELEAEDRESLRAVIENAAAVLWVEPGTYTISRELIVWRESLLDRFSVVAPCTHNARCGMLAAENERHWCHHFAPPPPGIMANSNWVRFAQRAGIDLRSLPYSFLVLERRELQRTAPPSGPDACLRIIGEPRVYKGYAKLFCCQAGGVRELRLQKRTDPALFKTIKDGQCPACLGCTVDGNEITATPPPGGPAPFPHPEDC